MIEQAHGTVIRIGGLGVYVRMDDGSKTVVDVPWLTRVELGMRVTLTESSDGVPIIRWGASIGEAAHAERPG